MRAFVAVRVPATREIEAVLKSLAGMQPAVKVVAADQLHVTLKFLGETDESLLPFLSAMIQEVAGGEFKCRVNLGGLGAFPRIERPTVVWAGMSGADVLNRLAAEFEERSATLGFARETRPFEPHVTLARVKFKPPAALAKLLRDKRCEAFGSVDVEAVELVQSDLLRSGSQYSRLMSAALSAAD